MKAQRKPSIDTLWDDVTTYYVKLQLKNQRVATRLLIFPAGLPEDGLQTYVLENLPDVIRIESFIEFEDGWLPTRERLTVLEESVRK